MSLRWRIMASTVLVIVLTVLISIGVGYYATQSRLGVFVDEIGEDEASRLAYNLSREYVSAGGWETVGRPLSEAGYIYDGVPQSERHEEGEGESLELFHKDPVRVVITGLDRRDADGRGRHTAGRLAVQTYYGPRDGFDRGNPGNCPGGEDRAANHVLG